MAGNVRARGTEPAEQVGPDRIRNVALVGHAASGKTTLVEALLVATGVVQRAGRVADGSTVSDHDDVEHRLGRSVNLSVASAVHEGVKINLVDTPGHVDFVGEVRAGLRAADAALFVVSAVDGVDGTTRMLWEECAGVGMPRAIVVTHLDQQRGDFDGALSVCQRLFGEGVQPLYLPLLDDRRGARRPDRPAVAAGLRLPARPGARPATPTPSTSRLIAEPRSRTDRGRSSRSPRTTPCWIAGWPARRSAQTP